MRGDTVFRVYGVHEGRDRDVHFGTFRTREEAESKIVALSAMEMHGKNWAASYHDQGFAIREHSVETDFEIPTRPAPREKYVAKATDLVRDAGKWNATGVEVFRRSGTEPSTMESIAKYERNYSMLQTFEPFRQGTRELALISREYTKSAVMDLATGEVIAEEQETSPGNGFCPVGFYVPDWWDCHDATIIPGCPYWTIDKEWPIGHFGFVWGCYWGDDSSWKVQYLDLSRVSEGIVARDERFGYVELATTGYESPCILHPGDEQRLPVTSARPSFIGVGRRDGVTNVRFALELAFDLATGAMDEEQRGMLFKNRP